MTDRTTADRTRSKRDVARRKATTEDPGGLDTLLQLQGKAGNAAVVAMLSGETDTPIQAKLQVGAVHDPAEAEADHIADQVLRNLEPGAVARTAGKLRRFMAPDQIRAATEEEGAESETDEHDTDGPTADLAEHESGESESTDADDVAASMAAPAPQGAADEHEAGESETDEADHDSPTDAPAAELASSPSGGESEASEADHEEPIARKITPIRRKADASTAPGHGVDGGPVEADVARKIESSRGGGRPLDDTTRARMESGFGADFSAIRVHEDSQAKELNRSLNAQAFTTGADIFVGSSGMDERVLAHELAHTVQQGAAVRRFMAVKDFEKLTYESWDSTKSTAQKEIIKMLEAYKACGSMKKGADGTMSFVVADKQLATAVKLVENMKLAAGAYIDAKEKDKKKKGNRFAGFQAFEWDASMELVKLKGLLAAAEQKGVAQDEVKVDETGLMRLQSHYKGTLSGAMEKAAMAVEQLAGSNGDSGEFSMDLEVPVSPGVFVGAHFKFEAKRGGEPKSKKPGAVEVGCELGFVVGGSALFAKIQAGLGGYFKAQGKDAQSAMKLVSYGLYRRCRESSVIPAGVGNKLWGGDSGAKGEKKAEEWSLGVENEEFGDDDSFVETGGYASVKASADVGIASIEGEVMGKTGMRHDKQSLMNSEKGGVGKKNTTGDFFDGGNLFAQKTTGRSVSSVELSAKATLAEAFGAELKLGFEWAASGKKDEPSEFKGFELDIKANGMVPAGSFGDKLSSVLISFAQTAKKLQNGQLEKASKMSNVGTGAKLAWGIADTTVTGVEGAPTADLLKGVVGMGAKKGAEGGKSLIEQASKVGIGLGYKLKYDAEKGTYTSSFEILHLSQLDAKIPGLLQAQLVRRKRLLIGTNSSGAWAWSPLA